MDETQQIVETLAKRFAQLPKVVQDAINSADVQKRLRELADTEKLHLDQWEELEHIVQMTLFGIESSENLEKNIQKEVGVSAEVAKILAERVVAIVFEPIRQELERQLEHPDAEEKPKTEVETARESILAQKVEPGTPPAPRQEGSIARAPASGAYKPGEASTTRKNVTDDPYREVVA